MYAARPERKALRSKDFPEKGKRCAVIRFDYGKGTIVDKDLENLFKVKLDDGSLCWNLRRDIIIHNEMRHGCLVHIEE